MSCIENDLVSWESLSCFDPMKRNEQILKSLRILNAKMDFFALGLEFVVCYILGKKAMVVYPLELSFLLGYVLKLWPGSKTTSGLGKMLRFL